MNANQIRKAERLAAIVEHLKATDRCLTAEDVHKVIPSLKCGFSTVQEYLRDLVHANKIHFIEAPRYGGNGAPKLHYAYGPSKTERLLNKHRYVDPIAQCNWLGVNEWQRGQHGRDRLQAALFGEVRA